MNDYEIEYENELVPDIIDQFAKWHIFFNKEADGKIHRFKQKYLRQNKRL